MKKVLSAALATALAVGSFTAGFAEKVDFSDLDDPTAAWAVEYIEEMAELGFISGYEDGTYQPHKEVTRHEVFALMARVLGSRNEANEMIIEKAMEKYESKLKLYSITWGLEDISFLLQKGVITETDLKTYLSGDLKSQAMPRGEIAVILTKAMGGEEEAKGASYVLSYNDVREINTSLRPYVGYVSEKNLMQGMETGAFSPSSSVLRSQIAAILSRVHSQRELSFAAGKTSLVDEDGKSVCYINGDGEEVWAAYDENVLVTHEGELIKIEEIQKGLAGVYTYSGDKIVGIDIFLKGADETFNARYISRATSNGVTRVTFKRFDGTASETIECAQDLSVEYEGSPATLVNFKDGDYVTIVIDDGVIAEISGKPGNETIAGATIKSITIEPEVVITISHANRDYDGNEYTVSEEASIIKNTEVASLSDVYVGDTVTLGLTYGVVTSVSAISSASNVEGTIKEIRISASPSMVVTVKGQDNEYSIPNDVEIDVNGEAATVYDLRVGDSITMTLESKAIKKIRTVTAQSTSGSIVGVVSNVNASYGFIKVAYTNQSGYTVEEYVYCKDATTNIMTSSGQNKKLKDIKVGNAVTAHGTISNGAFTAKVIVVTE